MKKAIAIMAAVVLSFGCIIYADDVPADDSAQKPERRAKKGDGSKSCLIACNKSYNSCMSPISKARMTGQKVDEKKITRKCTADRTACESRCEQSARDDSVR